MSNSNPLQPAQRHAELSSLLRDAQLSYHDRDQPIMDDATYDAFMHELRTLEANHPELPREVSLNIGADHGGTVQHITPMQSLSNTYTPEDLQGFNRKLNRTLGLEEQTPHPVTIEYKLDGLSANLTYVGGTLIHAATRGNGSSGENITHQIQQMNLPSRVAANGTVEIRGEIYMPRSVMATHNAEHDGRSTFVHTRNAAVGSLRKGTPERLALLRFSAYGLGSRGELTLSTQSEALEWLREQGFTVTPHRTVTGEADAIWNAHQEFVQHREQQDFDADGTVIKVDALDTQTEAGRSSHSPTWATAIKFEAVGQPTVLENVTFSVGRTGAITPTAALRPVNVDGATISSATLHNDDYLRALDLHYGDTVIVKRAAGVIPKVTSVVTALRPTDAKPVTIPSHCPSCAQPLTRPEQLAGTFCVNHHCPERVTASLENSASKDVLNILGMGEAVVQALRERGVTHYAELYPLTTEDLAALQLAGKNGKPGRQLGQKTAAALHAQIQASRNATMTQHLRALDIPMLGNGTSKRLARHFPSLAAFRDAALSDTGTQQLEAIEDIGPDTARSIIAGLRSGASERIDQLSALGIVGAPSAQLKASDALADLKICVTGTLSRNRDDIERWLASHGAQVSKNVTKTLTYLLAGDKAGSKLAKAEKDNVPVISETALQALCHNRGLTWLD